jgi:hypothetical protein
VYSPKSVAASTASSSCWYITGIEDTSFNTGDVIDLRLNLKNEIQVGLYGKQTALLGHFQEKFKFLYEIEFTRSFCKLVLVNHTKRPDFTYGWPCLAPSLSPN